MDCINLILMNALMLTHVKTSKQKQKNNNRCSDQVFISVLVVEYFITRVQIYMMGNKMIADVLENPVSKY